LCKKWEEHIEMRLSTFFAWNTQFDVIYKRRQREHSRTDNPEEITERRRKNYNAMRIFPNVLINLIKFYWVSYIEGPTQTKIVES